jgi:hypothetical protein
VDPRSDIDFWSRQLSEHALFLHLGLEVEPYKSRAAALHDEWEAARRVLPRAPSLNAARAVVSSPTQRLGDFKYEVLARMRSGQWLGWLFPLFVDHTLRELKYFVERVWHGGAPPERIFCANIDFMREHAEFAEHLLDPTEKDAARGARAAAGSFSALRGGCAALTPDLINLGDKAGKDLDKYLRSAPILPPHSVIHPVLAAHVVREGERFLDTMRELASLAARA